MKKSSNYFSKILISLVLSLLMQGSFFTSVQAQDQDGASQRINFSKIKQVISAPQPDDRNSPIQEALRPYAARLAQDLQSALNPRSGMGTGAFMNGLSRMAKEMREDPRLAPDKIDLIAELRILFVGPNGEPKLEEVNAPKSYCDYLNVRLKKAGIGFIQTIQSPRSRLLELYYQLGSVGYEKVDLNEIVRLSKKIYSETGETLTAGSNDQVVVPIFNTASIDVVLKKLDS
ncbi:MAG: hypothetical protein JWQ35_1252, partial [Bacteriovoracaceae bacterium]|nr:hypothetical protein [Bacteriovoracaceae bacterium]